MKILTVCLGNICRSPIAQGLLEYKVNTRSLLWHIDSAGTSGWHDGEHPDPRAVRTAKKYGIDISSQISRKITPSDFEVYDFILAMDSSNYNDLKQMSGDPRHHEKIHLVMNFLHPGRNMAVPDPYYDNRFDEVYHLLDQAIDSFIYSVLTAGMKAEQ
jgi:protein-tyrosine phosphatase